MVKKRDQLQATDNVSVLKELDKWAKICVVPQTKFLNYQFII